MFVERLQADLDLNPRLTSHLRLVVVRIRLRIHGILYTIIFYASLNSTIDSQEAWNLYQADSIFDSCLLTNFEYILSDRKSVV